MQLRSGPLTALCIARAARHMLLGAGIRRPQMDTPLLDRRTFVLGASAAAALAPLLAAPGAAQEAAVPAWQEAVKRILGDAQPTGTGKLTLDLPEIAENGNMVPFTVTVESPMTDKDNVKAIHVVSTANPQPNIVTFRFTLLSGRASAASRMRLAGSQEVIAVAETGDGEFLMTRRTVRVTISGG
jgi:sulfur-oxidizing protein SoxY